MTGVFAIRKKEDGAPAPPFIPASAFQRFLGRACRAPGIKRAAQSAGVVNGWLSFAHKTGEARIENMAYLFDGAFRGTPVYATVKCDGQSATFAAYKNLFFIASRNAVPYRRPMRRALRELKEAMIKSQRGFYHCLLPCNCVMK